MDTFCTITDCGKPVWASGFCSRHYQRHRKHGHPLAGGPFRRLKAVRPRRKLSERIEAQSIPEPNTGCFIWFGPVSDEAKGSPRAKMFTGSKTATTARLVYELGHGKIPDGLCVCHRCDNPLCVNPDHLWLGTRRDNTQDMIAKGRHRSSKRRAA